MSCDGATRRAAFRGWFGLRRAEANLLVALYDADGALCRETLTAEAKLRPGTVKTHICRLRQALDVEAIDSGRRQGYVLTEIGREECSEAIRQMGVEQRAA